MYKKQEDSLMNVVLTIGGSDTLCASGIQGDIKAIMRNGAYAVSAVASLVSKNTKEYKESMAVSPEFLASQIDAIFDDVKVDAVKVGMITSAELIRTVAEKLRQYKPANIIVDPVIPTKHQLVPLDEDAVKALEEELLPLADIITPDLREAALLADMEIETESDLIEASKIISTKYNATVISKAGLNVKLANDLLFRDNYYKWFWGKAVTNPNNRGAGNSISAALAANLAKGYEIDKAFKRAKDYVTAALDDQSLDIGSGTGPINQSFGMDDDFIRVLSDEEISRA